MKIRFAEHVLVASIDDEAVVLNTENEQYYGLNQSALQMVETLTQAPSVEAARAELSTFYDVAPTVLSDDLDHLIAELAKRGLLEQEHAA